jgi:hypothetical protein
MRARSKSRVLQAFRAAPFGWVSPECGKVFVLVLGSSLGAVAFLHFFIPSRRCLAPALTPNHRTQVAAVELPKGTTFGQHLMVVNSEVCDWPLSHKPHRLRRLQQVVLLESYYCLEASLGKRGVTQDLPLGAAPRPRPRTSARVQQVYPFCHGIPDTARTSESS